MIASKNQLDTKKGLAERLGMSRTTLDTYLNQKDAPQATPGGLFDVLAVTGYIQEHSRSERTAVKVGGGKRDLYALKKRELGLKCEKLQLQVEAERGLYIRKSIAENTVTVIVRTIMATQRRVFEVEMPSKLVGLDAIAITERMRGANDAAAKELNNRLTWKSTKE